MTVRKASKAGSWYAGSANELKDEVELCLSRGKQLYGEPLPTNLSLPVAAVVPHAGLAFSGPVAAVAYRMIRDCYPQVDTFVIFGACHRYRLAKPAIWAENAWQTPLGDIAVDTELAAAFIHQGLGEANEKAHTDDNAIELQTPFLRFLFPEAKIVPIAMSFFPDSWRMGESASVTAAASGKTVIAIASTDLTHYGSAFGKMPAGTGQKALDWLKENDDRWLATLVDMDLENIVPVAQQDESACGAGAAAATAGWAKARGSRKGRILAQTNSYDIMPSGQAEHMVGYASLVYEAT